MAFDNPVFVIRGRFERGALPRMPHVEVPSLPFWGKMDRQATRLHHASSRRMRQVYEAWYPDDMDTGGCGSCRLACGVGLRLKEVLI